MDYSTWKSNKANSMHLEVTKTYLLKYVLVIDIFKNNNLREEKIARTILTSPKKMKHFKINCEQEILKKS